MAIELFSLNYVPQKVDEWLSERLSEWVGVRSAYLKPTNFSSSARKRERKWIYFPLEKQICNLRNQIAYNVYIYFAFVGIVANEKSTSF